MNNYILINRTFTEVTPESAEIGDFSDSGFIEQDEQLTFGELVRLMKEFNQPSSSPNNGSVNNWYSSGSYTSDYSKGIEREESIHYSRNNTINAAKYWTLAAKYAGLLK